jgi:CubicO group peptidase (beta-lactamase class C family)
MPEQLEDGWVVSTLSAEGMDTQMIERLTGEIDRGTFRGIYAMLIVRNGALVHEAYFQGHDRDALEITYSITKSVTSSLIGIATDQGSLEGVDELVLPVFSEHEITDPLKQSLRLEHLLTLTAGLEWDETSYSYSDPRNTEYGMVRSDDWMRYVLQRPMSDAPGARFVYNTGAVHLLAGVIRRRTGLHADAFAEANLFGPMGIARYEWNTDPQGHPCTGGTLQGLRLTPRDVAKFGSLFLNQGRWNGTRVVSERWVEQSTQSHVSVRADRQLGYLWWRGEALVRGRRIPYFYAAGFGGQTIHLVPDLGLMIVLLCWSNEQDADIFIPIRTIYEAALGG